jgi:hypothetical protein
LSSSQRRSEDLRDHLAGQANDRGRVARILTTAPFPAPDFTPLEVMIKAIRTALIPHALDGTVALPGAIWLVSSR